MHGTTKVALTTLMVVMLTAILGMSIFLTYQAVHGGAAGAAGASPMAPAARPAPLAPLAPAAGGAVGGEESYAWRNFGLGSGKYAAPHDVTSAMGAGGAGNFSSGYNYKDEGLNGNANAGNKAGNVGNAKNGGNGVAKAIQSGRGVIVAPSRGINPITFDSGVVNSLYNAHPQVQPTNMADAYVFTTRPGIHDDRKLGATIGGCAVNGAGSPVTDSMSLIIE